MAGGTQIPAVPVIGYTQSRVEIELGLVAGLLFLFVG